ncbi:MAG: hypothetical protein IKF90_00175 [Parasporobacterium sp.]|nr:hypothetical protein [Parasporobacterium sp.]
MKILVLNGSPKRDNSDTMHITRAFLVGMNKATGILLFLLSLTIPAVPLKYSAIVVCAVATFAAIQEGHFIRTGRE